MQLGELHTKFVKNFPFGQIAKGIAALVNEIVCKWAMMFAGCCPTLRFSDGDDKLSGAEMMSAEELSGLRKVFDTFDANKDGFLTIEELCAWMKKLGRSITKPGLLKILQSCDWNNDGRLDFHEFVALTQTLHNHDTSGRLISNGQIDLETYDGDEVEDDVKSEMREAFQIFDKDGNGLISPLELRATLCELGLLSSPGCLSRIHSMIEKVDVDGDGHVSFVEFETMMNGK